MELIVLVDKNRQLHHNCNISARISTLLYITLYKYLRLIFLGNCGAGKYPLLRALNVALTDKSSGSGDDDDGGSCDPEDYSTTARSVVTRKPWVPTPLPPQDSNEVADSSLAPPGSGLTD